MASLIQCERCGCLLKVADGAPSAVWCPRCRKPTAVPGGLESLPRPRLPQAGGTQGPAAADALDEMEVVQPASVFLSGMERLMPFVLSLFFHLGLILATVFVGTVLIERKEAPREIIVPGTAMIGEEVAGGTLTPTERPGFSGSGSGGGGGFSRITATSARSALIVSGGGSGNARPGLPMIGLGGAVGGTGEGTGTGTGTSWFSGSGGGGGGGSFFGIGPGRGRGGSLARHVVYVVDRSGSMLSTFDAVRLEMLSSIGMLDGTRQDFDVILFSEGWPLEPVARRLVPATREYKAAATGFLERIYPKGQTDPIPALNRAFDVLSRVRDGGGKVIFLLTDSDFPDNQKVIELCRARNAARDVRIFTYLYGDRPREAEQTMRTIARENGGRYKYISPED